jgi:hypothetical protein
VFLQKVSVVGVQKIKLWSLNTILQWWCTSSRLEETLMVFPFFFLHVFPSELILSSWGWFPSIHFWISEWSNCCCHILVSLCTKGRWESPFQRLNGGFLFFCFTWVFRNCDGALSSVKNGFGGRMQLWSLRDNMGTWKFGCCLWQACGWSACREHGRMEGAWVGFQLCFDPVTLGMQKQSGIGMPYWAQSQQAAVALHATHASCSPSLMQASTALAMPAYPK